MNHPDEVTEAAGQAAYAVMQEAADAGNFVFAAGMPAGGRTDLVPVDGSATDGPYPGRRS